MLKNPFFVENHLKILKLDYGKIFSKKVKYLTLMAHLKLHVLIHTMKLKKLKNQR